MKGSKIIFLFPLLLSGVTAAEDSSGTHGSVAVVKEDPISKESQPTNCDSLSSTYDKDTKVDAAELLTFNAKSFPHEGVEAKLYECMSRKWALLMSGLEAASTDDLDRFSAAGAHWLSLLDQAEWLTHIEKYHQAVGNLRERFSDLFPKQTPSNKLLVNTPFSLEVRDKAKDLFNIFQFNFDKPSEIVRLRAFLEQEQKHFSLDKKTDFSKLINGLVAVGRFAPKLYREFRLAQPGNGGCGEFSNYIVSILKKQGLDAENYFVIGLKGGVHSIVGIRFDGRYYMLDTTIAQYSDFNLPSIVTPQMVFAKAKHTEMKPYEHFGMESYIRLYKKDSYPNLRPQLSETEIKAQNIASTRASILKYIDVPETAHKISGLMTRFEKSTAEANLPDWGTAFEKEIPHRSKIETVRGQYTLEEAKKIAVEGPDYLRFGAIFDLGTKFDTPETNSIVLAALKDKNPMLRAAAALSLKKRSSLLTISQALKSALSEEHDASARACLEYALGQLKFKTPTPHLLHLTENYLSGDYSASAAAAGELLKLGPGAEGAVPALLADQDNPQSKTQYSGLRLDIIRNTGVKALPLIFEKALHDIDLPEVGTEGGRWNKWINGFDNFTTNKELSEEASLSNYMLEDLRRRMYGN